MPAFPPTPKTAGVVLAVLSLALLAAHLRDAPIAQAAGDEPPPKVAVAAPDTVNELRLRNELFSRPRPGDAPTRAPDGCAEVTTALEPEGGASHVERFSTLLSRWSAEDHRQRTATHRVTYVANRAVADTALAPYRDGVAIGAFELHGAKGDPAFNRLPPGRYCVVARLLPDRAPDAANWRLFVYPANGVRPVAWIPFVYRFAWNDPSHGPRPDPATAPLARFDFATQRDLALASSPLTPGKRAPAGRSLASPATAEAETWVTSILWTRCADGCCGGAIEALQPF